MENRKNADPNHNAMNDENRRETFSGNEERKTVKGEDFEAENKNTRYDRDNDSLMGTTRRTSGKVEEGDEDYDDEAQGKDFEDYNEEYKKEQNKNSA